MRSGRLGPTNMPLPVIRSLSFSVCALITLVLAGGIVRPAPAAESPDAKAQPSPASSPTIEHLAPRTVIEAGSVRVIAFRAAAPPDADLELPTTAGDPSVLAVVRTAALSAGHTLGYVRVAGRQEGRTTLDIAGATLDVEVISPRRRRHEMMIAPRIVGPSEGAVVWGPISIGVDVELRPGDALLPIVVRGPNGIDLEPIEDTGPAHPPRRQLRFEIDADDLPEGPCTLTPIARLADGTERAGASIQVRVFHPAPDMVTEGEAERRYDVRRPQRFADDRMNVGRDRMASGGGYFTNLSAQPAACFPLEAATSGWYQVVLVARGTRAQGVLPTIGIVIDEGEQSGTNGQVLGEQWHRFAVGIPFHMDEGDHVVTPFFANDFFIRGRADRNLYLDMFEIARVADAEPGAAGGDDAFGDSMMFGEAGMMAGAMTDAAMTGASNAGAAEATVIREIDDPYGLTAAPLRVAFTRPLEDFVLPGLLEVEGRCWWSLAETAPAPAVTLLVNGEPVAEQRTGAPRFWVDPSCFEPGMNRIQLVASTREATARTPVQTVRWPETAVTEPRPAARRHHRYSIHEEAWDREILLHLRPQSNTAERRAAVLSSNGSIGLELPDEIEGAYDIMMDVRGDHFGGPPIAEVSIDDDVRERVVGRIEAPTGWELRPAGRVELKRGPKRLVVAFRNDRHVKGVGDRNLWFQSVILVQRPPVPERVPPVVEIIYPPVDHEVWMADAVVVEASDNASLATVELLVDGASTGIVETVNRISGRVLFPLLARELEPGPHTIAARVTDVSGNTMDGEPRRIVVADTAPATRSPYDRAVHLLNRFGYGPGPRELASILVSDEQTWLADQLGRGADHPGDMAALGTTLTHFPGRNQYEVPQRALAHLLLTPNPVRARFVLWADNHFSTWIRKTGGPRKWNEHVEFARLGVAPFRDLLFASAQSPAMLAYLDQDQSVVDSMNENYAREIMELHTLGVDGGYAQEDVTSLARLLTGWSAVMEGDGRGGGMEALAWSFRFDPNLNENEMTSVVGMSLPAATGRDRYDRIHLALEVLVAHPSTARFVSRKLVEHYVGVPAPEAIVDELAVAYLETGGDLSVMLAALAAHPEFWAPAQADRVAHPIDYAVRVARTSRAFNPWQIAEFLNRSGRGLFDRPTPDGYPEEDSTVTDSNALAQRWRFAHEARWQLVRQVPAAWRYHEPASEDAWSQRVIDLLAIRLTGRVLTDTSNEAAVALLRNSEGKRDERVQMMAPFIAQLPEANLR